MKHQTKSRLFIVIGLLSLTLLSGCTEVNDVCIYSEKHCYRDEGWNGVIQTSCQKDYDFYYLVGQGNTSKFYCSSERYYD